MSRNQKIVETIFFGPAGWTLNHPRNQKIVETQTFETVLNFVYVAPRNQKIVETETTVGQGSPSTGPSPEIKR